MKIVTNFDYPPIPVRDMDYSAYDYDRIDGAPDAGPSAQRMGRGRTPEDALQDLVQQACDDYTPEELHEAEGDALDRGDTLTLRFIDAVRAIPEAVS